MDLNNISLFNIAGKEFAYLTERQKVIAANIANANTPGYLAKDLEKPKFADELKSTVSLRMTHEKHMSGLPTSGFSTKIYTPKPDMALTIDGNGVIIEDQLNKMSETKGDYNRLITIYTQFKNMLSTANTQVNS